MLTVRQQLTQWICTSYHENYQMTYMFSRFNKVQLFKAVSCLTNFSSDHWPHNYHQIDTCTLSCISDVSCSQQWCGVIWAFSSIDLTGLTMASQFLMHLPSWSICEWYIDFIRWPGSGVACLVFIIKRLHPQHNLLWLMNWLVCEVAVTMYIIYHMLHSLLVALHITSLGRHTVYCLTLMVNTVLLAVGSKISSNSEVVTSWPQTFASQLVQLHDISWYDFLHILSTYFKTVSSQKWR